MAGKLSDKAATSFTSAINRYGGQESTLLSFNNVFYHWGSVIVAPGYTNPAARIPPGRPETREPLPASLAPLRDALHSSDVTRAAIAALAAFCAPTASEMARLLLTDVRDGRLHLPGRTVPLAAPARQRLAAYLDYRALTWPDTANPHLFIHYRAATHTGPVQADWVTTRLGMSAQAIREDRILHEAQATRGDVRRLCDLFGLPVSGAERYTATVDPRARRAGAGLTIPASPEVTARLLAPGPARAAGSRRP